MIKGMVGIIAGGALVGSALGGIANAGMGGIGRATQSLVSVGFMGHAAKLSGASKLIKWKWKV